MRLHDVVCLLVLEVRLPHLFDFNGTTGPDQGGCDAVRDESGRVEMLKRLTRVVNRSQGYAHSYFGRKAPSNDEWARLNFASRVDLGQIVVWKVAGPIRLHRP